MIQPDALKSPDRLKWSTGRGTDVWALFNAAIGGDLATVQQLVAGDPALVRTHHAYRTPLYFAVRENRREVAEFLLDQGADPIGLAVNDTLLDICRDRGYPEMEQLLEAKMASLHHASARGEAVALAIRSYDPAAVRRLLDASPELIGEGDRRGNQPIHWAAMTRQLDLIDELYDGEAETAVAALRAVSDSPTVVLLLMVATLLLLGTFMDMGPLITAQHRDRVRAYVDAGVAEGAELVVDGRSREIPQSGDGYFLGGCLFSGREAGRAAARAVV